MESVFIPAGPRPGATARLLLDIVGRGREGEVESATTPDRGYRVPQDVAVEYRRITSPAPVPEPEAPTAPEPEPPAAPATFTIPKRTRTTRATGKE